MPRPGDIRVSLKDRVKRLASDLVQATRSKLADGARRVFSPGRARQTKGKIKINVNRDTKTKSDLQRVAEREVLKRAYVDNGSTLQNEINKALREVVIAIATDRSKAIRVFGTTLGTAKPKMSVRSSNFARFIQSPEGAGEIGLPDPVRSISELSDALVDCIDVMVTVTAKGPKASFVFDQERLLRKTPHPANFTPGAKPPFYSWLSLVTGPDFASAGTPGFGLARISDIRKAQNSRSSLTRRSSKVLANSNGVSELVSRLARASRTRDYAGESAGLMLSIRSATGRKSPAESLAGISSQYKPSRTYKGFWDLWWNQNRAVVEEWTQRIVSEAIRQVLTG